MPLYISATMDSRSPTHTPIVHYSCVYSVCVVFAVCFVQQYACTANICGASYARPVAKHMLLQHMLAMLLSCICSLYVVFALCLSSCIGASAVSRSFKYRHWSAREGPRVAIY